MVENPMVDPGHIQQRYAQWTPCRECEQRVEDDPSPDETLCQCCYDELKALERDEENDVCADQFLYSDYPGGMD